MTTNPRGFWRLALTPKWIGALLLALAVAAAFALLGQWQLERSFREVGTQNPSPTASVAKPIDEVVTAGKPLTAGADGTRVSFEIMLDTKNSFVVANRQQDGELGYWLIANSRTVEGASLTLALGFTPDLATAENARTKLVGSIQAQAFLPHSGAFLATEAPLRQDPAHPHLLQSLSIAQLVNLYSPESPLVSYPGFVALDQQLTELELIDIGAKAATLEVNYLNIFYAVEWALFAGFAVFLWWRLVKDAVIAERLN